MWVPYSAGGLDSTVEDLYRWDQALYTNQLVPQTVLDAIYTPYAPDPNVQGAGYGYGWAIGFDNGHRVFSHVGGAVGFVSIIERYPDDKATIIILSNDENTDVSTTAGELSQKLFAR